MAYEAINNAGALKLIITILNDNDMPGTVVGVTIIYPMLCQVDRSIMQEIAKQMVNLFPKSFL